MAGRPIGSSDSHGRAPLLDAELQPELTAAWKLAVERGYAEGFCDRIVREREIPDRLVSALCGAFRVDDNAYDLENRRMQKRRARRAA